MSTFAIQSPELLGTFQLVWRPFGRRQMGSYIEDEDNSDRAWRLVSGLVVEKDASAHARIGISADHTYLYWLG